MSVYLEDEIALAEKRPGDLQEIWPGYWIFCLTGKQLQEEFGQQVSRDPQDDFPGHALVRDPSGKRSPSKRSKMAAACTLEISGDGPADFPAVDPAASLSSPGPATVPPRRRWWHFWRHS